MRNLFKSLSIEIQTRVLSSPKRIIKFFGVLIVPFLYAFVLIMAFWNPMANLGRVPASFLDNEGTYFTYKNLAAKKYGVLVDKNGKVFKTKDEIVKAKDSDNLYLNTTNENITYMYDDKLTSETSLFDTLIKNGVFKPNDANYKNKEETKWSTKNLSNITFNNFSYLQGEKAKKEYKNKSDFVQVYVPENFSAHLLKELYGILSHSIQLKDFTTEKLKLYTTFERNYVVGYFFENILKNKDALMAGILIQTLREFSGLFPQWSEIVDKLKLDSFIDTQSGGSKEGYYGIGLGQLFITLGLFVGAFVQTFIYDRAKRFIKANAIQWYFSKTLLMYLTGVLQATLLLATLSLSPFNIIGSSALLSTWLWMLFIELIIVICVQALWFSFRDETVGRFMVIVYMVMNISSGWGTFPAILQFGIFHFLSHFAIFSYSISGFGAIFFSISENGFNIIDTLYLLKQAGFLSLFLLFFITIGIYGAIKRNREICFGTYKGKQITNALDILGMEEYKNNFFTKLGFLKLYKWHNIKQLEYNEELKKHINESYPWEKQFKWFKKKGYTDVKKPNESDNDIMSRNDSTEV